MMQNEARIVCGTVYGNKHCKVYRKSRVLYLGPDPVSLSSATGPEIGQFNKQCLAIDQYIVDLTLCVSVLMIFVFY